MTNFILLLLPVAAASGWYLANKSGRSSSTKQRGMVSKDYLLGLNFLLEEQPDKAVDVFIKMLEVDSDTVETHLALGSLFRRRGEVDRAIRIHQNLIARPHLDREQRLQALLALGQDYMRAGVLDRAERIFLEMVETDGKTTPSLYYLLDIYQQEKAWEQAIAIAKKLETVKRGSMHANIAHYYCELAQNERQAINYDQASKHLRKAISIDPKCVRASVLQGDLEVAQGNYKAAIRFYKQIKSQDPDYLSEILQPLADCYATLGNDREFIQYLRQCLEEYARISVVLLLADRIEKMQDNEMAIEFISEYLRTHPSLRGLNRLIELQLRQANQKDKENLYILRDITESMLANKPNYRCIQCGFQAKKVLWLCPSCKRWNLVKPIHGLEGD